MCVQVHDSVRLIEGNMESLTINQQYATEGVYILCK